MQRRRRWIAGLALATAGLVAATGAAAAQPADNTTQQFDAAADALARDCRIQRAEKTEIAAAKIIIEFNAADGDLGVHGQFDDTGWSELCVTDPNGRSILNVTPRNALGDLTMASLFFESREPTLAEFGFSELAAAFPEGIYRIRGISHDGTQLVGEALFSHDVPAEPVITAPTLADDEEAASDAAHPGTELVVAWDAVTETVDGSPIDITAYEVILTKVDHDDPNGFSRPAYDVHVGPDVTSLPVPDEFVEAGTLYELEVLALETTGNQTIAVGYFTTAEGD